MISQLSLIVFGCENSTPSNDVTPLYFPNLPTTVETGGKYQSLPNKSLNKTETKDLVIKLTRSDRHNASGLNTCRNYYHNLQKIYNKKDLPSFKG